MDNINFVCQGDNLEEIPRELSKEIGITFPGAHTNSRDMAVLAREMRKYTNNSICIVPFCTTVEAEALGGKIKLGNEQVGPRVDSYLCSRIEEVQSINGIDLGSGRIAEVLKCIEDLKSQDETVALNVEGPFTIISSLIDPMIFYRGIRKNKEIIEEFLKVIEDSIIKYIIEGVRRGAEIISYGDPVGAMDIVGPKVYEEVSGRTTFNIIKRLQRELDKKVLIHLCGKTSTAFENLGFSDSYAIEFDEEITYGEALCNILAESTDTKIVGHSCIKRTRLSMKKPVVWEIKLKQI